MLSVTRDIVSSASTRVPSSWSGDEGVRRSVTYVPAADVAHTCIIIDDTVTLTPPLLFHPSSGLDFRRFRSAFLETNDTQPSRVGVVGKNSSPDTSRSSVIADIPVHAHTTRVTWGCMGQRVRVMALRGVVWGVRARTHAHTHTHTHACARARACV